MSTSPKLKKAMSDGTKILFRNSRQKQDRKSSSESITQKYNGRTKASPRGKNGNSSKRLFKSQNRSSSQFFVAQLPLLSSLAFWLLLNIRALLVRKKSIFIDLTLDLTLDETKRPNHLEVITLNSKFQKNVSFIWRQIS